MNKIYVKIEEAEELGFKAVEKRVLAQFKKYYKGDWKKAEIIADVEDGRLVYELKGAES